MVQAPDPRLFTAQKHHRLFEMGIFVGPDQVSVDRLPAVMLPVDIILDERPIPSSI
ncbi:MAG: hypothetical protein ACKVVP_11005 [Chloroflexota bacterium]